MSDLSLTVNQQDCASLSTNLTNKRCSSENSRRELDPLHTQITQVQPDGLICIRETVFIDPRVDEAELVNNISVKIEPADIEEGMDKDIENIFASVFIEPDNEEFDNVEECDAVYDKCDKVLTNELISVTSKRLKRETNTRLRTKSKTLWEKDCKETITVMPDIYSLDLNSLCKQTKADKPRKRKVEETDTPVKDCDSTEKIKGSIYKFIRSKHIDNDPVNCSKTLTGRNRKVHKRGLLLTDSESLKHLFICDICNKPFCRKTTLTQHILKHPKSLNCNYCSYKSYHKRNLSNHINARHTKSTTFDCPHCSYKTFRKGDIGQHVNAIHTKHVSFDCSYCDYKTYHKSYLNEHVNTKHTKSNVFNCSFCTYKTYLKGNLSVHVNAKHTKDTVFNCTFCAYKTYRKSSLNEHVNTKHTKNTSFECSYCSYKAYKREHLNRHVNAKHTKTVVFKCTLCSYKAYQKVNLTEHVNVKHSVSYGSVKPTSVPDIGIFRTGVDTS